MITLVVRWDEDVTFQVPDKPGIYRVEDPDEDMVPAWQGAFYFVHDGSHGVDVMEPPKGRLEDLDLKTIGRKIKNGRVVIG